MYTKTYSNNHKKHVRHARKRKYGNVQRRVLDPYQRLAYSVHIDINFGG